MKNAGFTLLELIIVISIISLLSGSAFVYYNSFSSTKQLETESSSLANTLELARKRANSGDLSTSCSGDFLGYRVRINSLDYQLKVHCSASDSLVTNRSFANSVQADNTAIIDFKPIANTLTASCIKLSKPGVDRCRCLQIASSGTIENAFCSSCSSCP